MTEENPIYVNEDEQEKRSNFAFARTRAFKISAITLGSALALAGSFGAGVLAGEKIGGGSQGPAFGNGQFDHGHFPDGAKFPGHDFKPGEGFPGHDDDQQFQLPDPAASAPAGNKS